MINSLKIMQLGKKYKELKKMNNDLYQQYEFAKESNADKEKIQDFKEQLDDLSKEIDSFIEKEYALAVFEKYSKKKPQLIIVSSGETISWDEAFGSSFDEISKSLRHSLVGLVESPGRYKLL